MDKRDIKKIIKSLNGFCPAAPNKEKCWRCICQEMEDSPVDTWCRAGYYYKTDDET